MLETGKKCSWDEIKVGEVFAIFGCWVIAVKISNKYLQLIDSDQDWFHKRNDCQLGIAYLTEYYVKYTDTTLFPTKFSLGDDVFDPESVKDCLYKLPKKVQELWITP